MSEFNTISIIIAVIAGITGILLLLVPTTLIKVGEFFNRVYNLESFVYKRRIPFGLIFIVAGVLLLYFVW